MPEVIFNGPTGRLEGYYHQSNIPGAPLAVIMHPHPHMGGNMRNRIAITLAKTFIEMGFSVLRYNSRGVGKSQGRYNGGIGEISDAASALDWIQSMNPDSVETWVAGYSFGAFVAMQLLMRRPGIDGWISIAPPANDYDFSFLAPCPCSGLMIAGGRDTLAPEPGIRKVVDKLNTQKNVQVDYRIFAGADHLFASYVSQITEAVEDHVVRSRKEKQNFL
ncbi:alpha/beta hydrolase [Acetobacteraceae bacterium]|nr:alpha/beta hydrolase [Acetobacteraceae bacterium]